MQDSVSQDTRVAEVIRHESRSLGRECKLIDSALLAEDVIAVVYSTEPLKFGDDESREIRTATYVGTQPKYSTIVSTAWSRAQDAARDA